jgi:deoxyadenosine/deoxycytidine kinase
VYIVEGNIGAGKSTFLNLVADKLSHINVVLEPRQYWQNDDGTESLLTKFYHDPTRWAYTMETFTMVCRVKEHLIEQQNSNPNRIMERSIYSGNYCFAKNDFDNGFMNPIEWSLYTQWFNLLVINKCKPPLGFIYLQTDPEVSYERIRKRARSSETSISLDYLKQIDACHRAFLLKKEDVLPQLKDIPVLALDCNEEFEADPKKLAKHVEQVNEFLMKTQLSTATQKDILNRSL